MAGSQRTVVLVASMDSYLADRLRQALVALSGQLAVAQLGVALACVCRAPPSALRKLSRKAKISMPLLSDGDAEWLPKLQCSPGGEPVVLVVDAASRRVLASFSSVDYAPDRLVEAVCT